MTSFIGLLNNITSLSHTDLLNINTFRYIIFKKLHLLISPPVSSEKSFSVGTLSNIVTNTCLPKLKFSLESSDFTTGNKLCQLFSLKRQVHFIHLWENFCQNPSWILIVCQFFPINYSSWKTGQFNSHTTVVLKVSAAAAAAAKLLQSCPILCDPIDGSPPGSPILGILQARTLEWVAISFSNACKWKVKVKSLSCVQVLATPWTAAYQAPPSMGFSRQEYWSGCHCLLPSRYLLPVYCDWLRGGHVIKAGPIRVHLRTKNFYLPPWNLKLQGYWQPAFDHRIGQP